jgi:hypothetical protein
MPKKIMEVELECAVYGEGTMFPVRIAHDAKVSALQEAIFIKKRYNNQYKFDSSALTLYFAGKKEGKETKWIKSDSTLKRSLKRGRQESSQYKEMIPNWTLDDGEQTFSLDQKKYMSWWNSQIERLLNCLKIVNFLCAMYICPSRKVCH